MTATDDTTPALPDYTPAQLEAGISNALTARDFKAVEAFLTLLALKDPHRAQVVYDTLKLGVAIGRERDAAQSPPGANDENVAPQPPESQVVPDPSAAIPTAGEVVLNALRSETTALLTECSDKQRALFDRLFPKGLERLNEVELRKAHRLCRDTVTKNRAASAGAR
jgi:hypothetical protein